MTILAMMFSTFSSFTLFFNSVHILIFFLLFLCCSLLAQVVNPVWKLVKSERQNPQRGLGSAHTMLHFFASKPLPTKLF